MTPKPIASTLRKLALPVSMLGLFALAIYIRLNFLIIHGGLEEKQVDWAMHFYYGGLTSEYLRMRDAILAWRLEPKLWSYMPGYPAFLATLDLFGLKDLRAARFVQIVIDSAAIFPLTYVVRRLTRSAFLGVSAASVYAAAPWLAEGSGYLLAEALVPAFIICVLAGMTCMRDHKESIAGWATLGFLTATLPFFRSEMVLLFVPLVFWAAIVASPSRRMISAAVVGLTFAAPLIAWAFRNYFEYGQFLLTPPVGWYAMWAGLGQVANDFGYFVDDTRALHVLKDRGLNWHSVGAEGYWKSEYLNAWREHTNHVLQATLFRMKKILFEPDFAHDPLPGMSGIVYRWFMEATVVAIVWLLFKKRWTDAVLISGPMTFAVLSLGFVYVEARYVRYGGLSYFLGAPVLAALAADLIANQFRVLNQFGGSGSIKAAFGATGVIAVLIHLTGQQASLVNATASTIMMMTVDANNLNLAVSPDATTDTLTFEPASAAASTTLNPSGLDVQSAAQYGGYLVTAPLNTNKAVLAVIRYRISLQEGGLDIGVLSGDQQTFLSHKPLAGPPGSIQDGQFRTLVESGSRVVISGLNPTGRGKNKFQIQSLEAAFLCSEGSISKAISNRHLPRIEVCRRQAFQR
jgi:hypothetical protein